MTIMSSPLDLLNSHIRTTCHHSSIDSLATYKATADLMFLTYGGHQNTVLERTNTTPAVKLFIHVRKPTMNSYIHSDLRISPYSPVVAINLPSFVSDIQYKRLVSVRANNDQVLPWSFETTITEFLLTSGSSAHNSELE